MVKRAKLARSILSSFLGKACYRVEYARRIRHSHAGVECDGDAERLRISPSVAPSSMAFLA